MDQETRELIEKLTKKNYELERRILHLEERMNRPAKSVQCPVCKTKAAAFMPYGETLRSNARCPKCGALERHRALCLYIRRNLERSLFRKQIRVLHVAPEYAIALFFRDKHNIDYYPVDINPNFKGIRETADITKLHYEDGFFDVIVCNHVLEHIEDEGAALRELNRVLKPGGVAFLNSPVFQRKETLENPAYNTPELRFKYYGQSDHVRRYGQDYAQRLESRGFKVQRLVVGELFSIKEIEKYALEKTEQMYICTK